MDADKQRAQRAVAVLGFALAALGAIGLIVAPRLAYLWAFMIGFGLVKLPGQALRWWRARRTGKSTG